MRTLVQRPQPPHDLLEHRFDACTAMGVAGASDHRDKVAGRAIEDQQGMQLVLAVVAVVGAPFLLPMGGAMPYFALFYDVVEDFAARRSPFQAEHLRLAQEAYRRGEMVLAGALGTPLDRALLVFHIDDPSTADAFAWANPYVMHGLVTH